MTQLGERESARLLRALRKDISNLKEESRNDTAPVLLRSVVDTTANGDTINSVTVQAIVSGTWNSTNWNQSEWDGRNRSA